MCMSATKIATRADLREIAWRDGCFGLGKEGLNSFMRHQVDLLVGSARLHGRVDQLLIPPSRPFEDRLFQCAQGVTERDGPVELRGLHPRLRKAMPAPRLHIRETNYSAIFPT